MAILQVHCFIPFGFDKTFEPIYACDKLRTTLKGVLIIVAQEDPMLNPADMKQLKCSTQTYIVPKSPSNDQNFNTDKNMYFDKVSKFLNN